MTVPAPAPRSQFVLLVDALPVRGRSLTPREAWSEAYSWVEQQQGVPDYRLASYGKGAALVAVAIREQERVRPLPAGTVVSAMRCEPAILDVLLDLASEIFIATRS